MGPSDYEGGNGRTRPFVFEGDFPATKAMELTMSNYSNEDLD